MAQQWISYWKDGVRKGKRCGKRRFLFPELLRRVRKVAVEDLKDLKLFGQIEQGSHRTMTVTLDLLRNVFDQVLQQVFSLSQIA